MLLTDRMQPVDRGQLRLMEVLVPSVIQVERLQ